MNLTILERLMLLGSLPKEANLVDLRAARKVREALEFGEEEVKEYSLAYTAGQGGGTYTWSPQFDDETVDIVIGERGSDIIVKALKDLDRQRKLTENHLSLWEKFVTE